MEQGKRKGGRGRDRDREGGRWGERRSSGGKGEGKEKQTTIITTSK